LFVQQQQWQQQRPGGSTKDEARVLYGLPVTGVTECESERQRQQHRQQQRPMWQNTKNEAHVVYWLPV
jgi:hypothetical protein